MHFHSEQYDWLVIAGKKAIYKGTGTINGVGNYKFLLSAIDGDLQGGDGIDRFRMRIWDEQIVNGEITETVIYDNKSVLMWRQATMLHLSKGSLAGASSSINQSSSVPSSLFYLSSAR